MQLLEQILVRKPDEIIKAGRHEAFSVTYLQLDLCSLGRELERIGDVAEGASFAQMLACEFEIVLTHILPDLQTGGCDDVVLRVALRAGDLDGYQFGGGGGNGLGGLTCLGREKGSASQQ